MNVQTPRVMARATVNHTMEFHVGQMRRVCQGRVRMVFVVAMPVQKRAEPVRQPKRAVDMMEYVGRLRRVRILITNA